MAFGDWLGRVFGKDPEPEQPRLELPRVKTSEELLAELDGFERDIAERVPAMVLSRVTRVASIVRETIPRLDQLGAGSYQAHSVVATATSYLPEAVGNYLRLPRSFADTRPLTNGKTALLLLCDQLDLLAYKMDQIFDAVCRADAAALVAHGQFLAEKFGGAGALELAGEIDVPPQPRSTAEIAAQPTQPMQQIDYPGHLAAQDEDDAPTGPAQPPPRRLEPPSGPA